MTDRPPEASPEDALARLRARVSQLERERLARLEAEHALRESEARYRELVSQCPDPIVVHRDGIMLFVNEAAVRMAGGGFETGDLVGRHVIDFVHPVERDEARDQLAAVSAGETPLEMVQNRVIAPDGRELVVESVERTVRFEGKPAVQVVVRDVTARVRAEEELRAIRAELEERVDRGSDDLAQALRELTRSEERHRALLGATPDSFLRVSRDGILLDFHARSGLAEHLGLPGRTGQSIRELLTPAQYEATLALLERVCRTGEMLTLEHPAEREGRVRWLESRIAASGADEVIAVVRDVSERRAGEDALRDSEERFRSIFEGAPMGVAIVGPDLRFLAVNPLTCAMLGYSEAELREKTFLEITHPDDVARDREHLERLRRDGFAHVTVEKRFLHKTGRVVPTRVTGSIVYGEDGSPRYGIGMYEDISEQRRVEEALEQARARLHRAEHLASIGTLAAGIAHEINNPIGSILLATQYALAEADAVPMDPATRESLETVAEHARRCGRIVKSVLQFARQEAQDRHVDDLNECVARIRDLARHLAESRDQSVAFRLAEAPLPVRVSSIGIEQVLLNLVRNAVEAGAPGATVWVETALEEGVARVRVRDRGRGMTGEDQTYLFDPFYTTRRSEGGTGLGLSISHGIVTDHGGTIQVDSQPGRGTTVQVDLPAEPPENAGPDGENP